ncbi:DUF6603 domain-containing protein, partial [Ilumatobacter nonamiensis]|uniref:DUF6603 domain-containing protein n=1 Tax=Ilumatobacter nonamiensis TaxID=467093 RepID=UPI00058CB3A3
LLYPEVRLTGGFAFAVWWKGQNAGQFVLTLGGYHPSFSRPGYPDVPRLGLEWRVSDAIVIKGGSYFALTSEALMAGVEVEVSADFGFVWAKVAFGANAIVYFDPFYFMADAYARISAGLKIKTFLGTIRISISIGARIEVQGPDFHGKATFEIGPCDVSVPFGNSAEHPGNFVTWAEFVPKYLEEVSSGTARAVSGITGKGTLPAATDGDTSAPSSDGTRNRPFEVFAEFEIQVVTTVPTTTFRFGATDRDVTPVRSDGSTAALGLSPMNAGDLDSILDFTLALANAAGTYVDRTADLVPLVSGMVQDTTETDGPTFGVDAFPLGVWGQPEDPDQPSQPIPKGEVVFAGNRVKLVATASLDNATGPPIDYYRVESGRRPLPLLAAGNARALMIAESAALGIDRQTATVTEALDLAESILFRDRSDTSLDGVVGIGARSNVGRRAYRQTRSAPPLFGSLAEGILSTNDANRTAARMDEPTPSIGRTPRAPFVTGYLANGAGVQLATTTTTVADGRIKRRPAPGTDSVRGRLGRSLPIKLTPTAAPGVIAEQTVNLRGAAPRTAPSSLGAS